MLKARAEPKGAVHPAHRGLRAYQEPKGRPVRKVLPEVAVQARKDLRAHPVPKALRGVPAPVRLVRRVHKDRPGWE